MTAFSFMVNAEAATGNEAVIAPAGTIIVAAKETSGVLPESATVAPLAPAPLVSATVQVPDPPGARFGGVQLND
jgi:hypothetical protein